MTEIVYVLTNPTMPGLIKIGRTTNLEQRVKSLSSDTGVPLPFEVFYACSVRDADEVERALHNAFGDHRINPKREFFEIDPERVYPVLKLVGIEQLLALRRLEPVYALFGIREIASSASYQMCDLSGCTVVNNKAEDQVEGRPHWARPIANSS